MSAKATPKEQFVNIFQNAVINSYDEDPEETLPSTVIAAEHRMDKQKQK